MISVTWSVMSISYRFLVRLGGDRERHLGARGVVGRKGPSPPERGGVGESAGSIDQDRGVHARFRGHYRLPLAEPGHGDQLLLDLLRRHSEGSQVVAQNLAVHRDELALVLPLRRSDLELASGQLLRRGR